MAELKTKVTTGKCLFSYVHVFVPTAMEEGQEKKYNISILIPKKDKATVAAVKAAIENAKELGRTGKWNGKVPKNLKISFGDGDTDKDDEVYAGHYYISAKSSKKPPVFDENNEEILDPDDFYSGCFGRACVNFYPYNVGSNGIAAGLQSLKKLADGEPLGGSTGSAADFDDEDFDDELL